MVKAHKSIAFAILFFMTLSQLSTDIYLSALPEMSIAFTTSSTKVQLSLSIFFLTFALSQLIYGPVSDSIGRKPTLLTGLVIFFSGSVVCAIAPSINLLLAGRALQGLGAGSCSTICRAMMQDAFTGKDLEKLSIYQTLIWSLVPVLAPLAGSYIQQYSHWRYSFILIAIIVLGAIYLCLRLPETLATKVSFKSPLAILKDYYQCLKNLTFATNTISAAGVLGILTVFNLSAPFILEIKLDFTPVQYGWSILAIAASFTLGSLLSRLLIHRFHVYARLTLGLSLLIVAEVVMFTGIHWYSTNLFTILVPVGIIQFGLALLFPVYAVNAVKAFSQQAGLAAALFGCVRFFFCFLVSGILAHVNESPVISMLSAFILITLLMISASLIIWRKQLR
jgi:Bcr/CflA subfamily drug resistance transporter